MPLLPQLSSKATSPARRTDRDDPTLPVILEFQSPSTAIIDGAGAARRARHQSGSSPAMLLCMVGALGFITVDRVVTAQARVVSKNPNIVVQPLETVDRALDRRAAKARSEAGQVLARLDPTFAAADEGALDAQVASLAGPGLALAGRSGRPAVHLHRHRSGSALQAAIYAQRRPSTTTSSRTTSRRSTDWLPPIASSKSDAAGYRERLEVAQKL